MANEERLRELEEKYEGYTVYDNSGSKIGKVDDLFVDEKDHEEYIGVKMGFLGTKSTLIPTEIVRVNEGDRTIEVSESKDHVKGAPSFSDDEDVTSEYEERIRRHFGLESLQSGTGRGSYGGAAAGGATSEGDTSDHEPSAYGTAGEDSSSSHEAREDAGSGSDTEYGERRDSDSAAGGYEGSEGYRDEAGDRGGNEDTGSTAASDASPGESSSSSSAGSKPTTSRQTEETETFQEGGRTKIRRRIIREEVVDADDTDARS